MSLIVLLLLPILALLSSNPVQAQAPSRTTSEATDWEQTVERVSSAVVSIRVNATRAFDTEGAGGSVATGFIIDAERGLVLTNRHVVGPGPVKAKAVFLNNEEIELTAVYRDPVHDFGVFRFDPAQVRFMALSELRLAPEKARVGAEIRVIGNDAGEKISILAGTLARLDREAPTYGRFRYNDFNTFYFQAASGTSGGSSGSPVVDRSGDVIALNAGARRGAASSYFLPLDRVVRAVDRIRQGLPVTRGTVQATFVHRPFDELRRLGLSPQAEAAERAARPDATGMLAVEGIVPYGPGQDVLELGDILLSVQGRAIHGFVAMEEILDDHVGQEVEVLVERGGQEQKLSLSVQDLHSITPSSYLEVGDVLLNELSYQQARQGPVMVGGAYVAAGGYMLNSAGVGARAVITAIGEDPIYSLDDAQQALAAIPDGARVPLRWFDLGEPRAERTGVMTMDRRWFPMRRCTWDAPTGTWPCEELAEPTAEPDSTTVSTSFPRARHRLERKLARSLVSVSFRVPFRVEGAYGTSFVGNGLVVDAEQGLVLVDRDTVPISLGDATVTVAGSVEVPAEVVHVHPLHNLALVRYDPALIGDTPVRSARLRVDPAQAGDRVWHIGLNSRASIASQRTRVERVEPISLPLPSPPFFRESNLDAVTVRDTARAGGGVLADRRGRVRAFWASFVDLSGDKPTAYFRGVQSETFAALVAQLSLGEQPTHRALGVDLEEVALVDARSRGLSAASAALLEEAGGVDRRAFMVRRIWADAPALGVLREGDLLLEVNGAPAVSLRRIEEASQEASVLVRVSRSGQEQTLQVGTVLRESDGLRRVLSWSGALLHEVHDAVPSQRGLSGEGVYVAWFWYGSPAAQFGLRPTRRILEVNGKPTPDLDRFEEAIAGIPDGGAVRLKTEDLDGRTEVITLETDTTFWPSWQLLLSEQGWRRSPLGG